MHTYDPCNSTALFENQPIDPIEIRIRTPGEKVSIPGYTDTVSDLSGVVDDCGTISYELISTDPDQPVPSLIQLLDDYENGGEYSLQLQSATEDDIGAYNLEIVAKLDKYYPTIPTASSKFTLTILPEWPGYIPPEESEKRKEP